MTQYTKEHPLRVFEAFAGYGSQSMALQRIKEIDPEFDFVNVGISEIEPNAIKAYHLVHGDVTNYGDISKIDWDKVPDFDFFTYSSPCQDWSNAGLQKGGMEGSGTRSSLLWECRRAILAKKPKYLMLENVKALVSGKFKPFFNKWEQELASYGYTNFWRVLNSKDYGIPQNRERVFLISILDCDEDFRFGDPYELPIRLKDMLEEKVDEKYYLDDEKVQKFIEHCDRKQAEGCGFKFEPTTGGG